MYTNRQTDKHINKKNCTKGFPITGWPPKKLRWAQHQGQVGEWWLKKVEQNKINPSVSQQQISNVWLWMLPESEPESIIRSRKNFRVKFRNDPIIKPCILQWESVLSVFAFGNPIKTRIIQTNYINIEETSYIIN